MFDNDLGQQKAGMAVMVWHMNGYNLNQRTFLYKNQIKLLIKRLNVWY